MNKFITILLILLTTLVNAQSFEGKYSFQDEYFNFSHDTVSFMYADNGCLINHRYGIGTYKIIDGYLFIDTKEYAGNKSVFYESVRKSVATKITVKNYDNNPVLGANILCLDAKNKLVLGAAINENGYAFLVRKENIKNVKISNVGYDEIIFKYDPKMDYSVILGECCVVENKTMLFRILSSDNDEMHLQELSLNYNETGVDEKAIKKLDRSIKKGEELYIRFEKN